MGWWGVFFFKQKTAYEIKECDWSSDVCSSDLCVVKNNKFYWVASVPFGLSTATESTFHLGIWVFGRKNINSDFTLALDYIEEGIDTDNFKINSFGNAGDYFFINHSIDGSISKTDDAANYTHTSIYESQIFNNDDSSQTKKLIGIKVFTSPLPATGSVSFF